MRFNPDEIMEFAENDYDSSEPHVRWNGRQIRNAFQIAIALAENEASEKMEKVKKDGEPARSSPKLRSKHFATVQAASPILTTISSQS